MLKIVFIGGECTGKTTLVNKLSRYFNEAKTEEFSRIYAAEKISKGETLGFEDVMPIVKGQIELEDNALKRAKKIAFFDSNPLASAVYSIWYYNKIPNELEQILKQRNYDLYLLCYPDLTWIADGIRDQEFRRDELFELFKEKLIEYGQSYNVIKSDGEKRFENAKKIIEKWI